jgi:Domain of unknown function (DUF397)
MHALDRSNAAWRKSSHSNGSGGSCVEVGTVWPKDAHYDRPVDIDIATIVGLSDSGTPAVAVRDSKDAEGPKLLFTADEWETFIAGVRVGEFDLS